MAWYKWQVFGSMHEWLCIQSVSLSPASNIHFDENLICIASMLTFDSTLTRYEICRTKSQHLLPHFFFSYIETDIITFNLNTFMCCFDALKGWNCVLLRFYQIQWHCSLVRWQSAVTGIKSEKRMNTDEEKKTIGMNGENGKANVWCMKDTLIYGILL